MTQNKIESKHPDYEAINEHSANSIILMGGSIAMRKNSAEVLPQNQYESKVNYDKRVKRSVLFNVYKSTLENLSNKPFQEPVKWSDDLPPQLAFVETNIDGSGMMQDAFFKQNVSDSMQFGKHMYLVNMPSLVNTEGEKVSEIDRKELGLNPFVSRIRPDSLISWFYGDDKALSMIKIQYQVDELINDEVTQVKKIDKWSRESIETWALREDNETHAETWFMESVAPNGLGEISLVTGDSIYSLPVLENLAELNMLHFSKASDKDNNVHMALTPFLLFMAFDKDDIQATVSVHHAYSSESQYSDIKWVELGGEGISLSIEDLKNLESQMLAYGNDVITDKGSAKTATEKKIDNDDKMSTLQSIVVDVQNSAKVMLNMMARWLNIDEPNLTLEIFKDFNITDQALEELKLLQKDFMNYVITKETYLNELVIRKIIKSDDFDVVQEVANTEVVPLEFDDETNN